MGPSFVGETELEWDANGNLARYGDRQLVYDFRNRLVSIHENGQELVRYEYDALNRRVTEQVDSVTYRTLWDGWRPVEEYADGSIVGRRVYGGGLDEILRLDVKLDAANAEFASYLPFYDTSGNVALLTDLEGRPVERYQYTPFGERWVWADSQAPEVTQVRWTADALVVELSEEIQQSALWFSVLDDGVLLYNETRQAAVAFELEVPVTVGRQANRRFVLRPKIPEDPAAPGSHWPSTDETVQLIVSAAATEDFFGNQPPADFAYSFSWPVDEQVLVDDASPRVEQVCVLPTGQLEVQFSEAVDGSAAPQRLSFDGAQQAWVVSEDGYRLTSLDPVAEGPHDLSIAQGPLDLSGLGLDEAFETSFNHQQGSAEQQIFSAPLRGQQVGSQVGNRFGFHGLLHDRSSGFVYARHRTYDPEMGRFLSADPAGYGDGANLYQYGLNSPYNYSDPTGQYAESLWDLASLSIGLASFAHNTDEGNVGMASLDAFGIVVDSVALAVPLVPGGAGVAVKAYRLAHAAEALKTIDQALNVGQGVTESYGAFHNGDEGWGSFYGGMAALGAGSLAKQGMSAKGLTRASAPMARGDVPSPGRGRGYQPACPTRCFGGGTPVLTEYGERPIEAIRVGDRIWALNHVTGEHELAEVVHLFERDTHETYLLTLGSDQLVATGDHPFFVDGRGWRKVEDLQLGERLVKADGSVLRLTAKQLVEQPARVYNFEVRGLHNYFVGREQVLVHNCGGGGGDYKASRYVRFDDYVGPVTDIKLQNGQVYALLPYSRYSNSRRWNRLSGEARNSSNSESHLLNKLRMVTGRPYPTKRGFGGRQQPYDPNRGGRYLPFRANPGLGQSPAAWFARGFAEGSVISEVTSVPEPQTRPQQMGQIAGQLFSTLKGLF